MKRMMMLTTTAYMSERFNRDNILILEQLGYEVHVVANFEVGNPTTKEVLNEFKEWVGIHHGKCVSIPVTKHPTDIKNFVAYKKLLALIETNHYEFIHCHTPVAGALGRLVAHKTKTKVIYTAHGFHFFKGAPFTNWMIYYPIEWFLSRWTDILITINGEDYSRAKRSFRAKSTEYIPGVGIDLDKFSDISCDREKKRIELGLQNDDIMLLSVGELNKNKNHEMVIRALARIKNAKVHYVIVGQGCLYEKLINLAEKVRVSEKVHLLGYRNDVAEIYQAADVFVFPSKREGLSVALMEAMASGLPIVCSKVRGNIDLITSDTNLFDVNDKKTLELSLQKEIKTVSEREYIKRADINPYTNLKLFDRCRVMSLSKKVYLKIVNSI